MGLNGSSAQPIQLVYTHAQRPTLVFMIPIHGLEAKGRGVQFQPLDSYRLESVWVWPAQSNSLLHHRFISGASVSFLVISINREAMMPVLRVLKGWSLRWC